MAADTDLVLREEGKSVSAGAEAVLFQNAVTTVGWQHPLMRHFSGCLTPQLPATDGRSDSGGTEAAGRFARHLERVGGGNWASWR